MIQQEATTAPIFLKQLWGKLGLDSSQMHTQVAFATSNLDGQTKENCEMERKRLQDKGWKDLNVLELEFTNNHDSAWKIVQKLASSPPVRIQLSKVIQSKPDSMFDIRRAFRACLDAIKSFTWRYVPRCMRIRMAQVLTNYLLSISLVAESVRPKRYASHRR